MNEIKIEICNVKLSASKATLSGRTMVVNSDQLNQYRGFELTPEDARDLGQALEIASMALFPETYNDDDEY